MPPPEPHIPRSAAIFRASASTKWPGITRLAVCFALLSTLLAVAQLVLGSLIVHKLLVYDREGVQCYQGSNASLGLKKNYPVTIVDLDAGAVEGEKRWSVDQKAHSISVFWFSTCLPISSTVFGATIVYYHVGWKRISNRYAVFLGIWMLLDWVCFALGDTVLWIDRFTVDDGWGECRVPHEYATRLWRERTVRLKLLAGRAWVVVAGMIVMTIYILLAMYAACLAYSDSKRTANMEARLTQAALPPPPPSTANIELQTVSPPPRPQDSPVNDEIFVVAVDSRSPSPHAREEEFDLGLRGSDEIDHYPFPIRVNFEMENPFRDPLDQFRHP